MRVLPTNLVDKLKVDFLERLAINEIPTNYISGRTVDREYFHIDIKHKHYQKLAYFRAQSLRRGILFGSDENKVPATIRFGNNAYRVSLSLKGRLSDHWEHDDIWSIKVSVRDGKTIRGMRSFALQHPKARGFVNEWVLHKLMSDAGIISLRYDFVEVNINGKGSYIYALEEGFDKRLIEHNQHKEGPILKFDRDFYWEGGLDPSRRHGVPPHWQYKIGLSQTLWGANIVPMPLNKTLRDTVQYRLFVKAKNLMDDFRRNKLLTSDVFDIPKLATYFAAMELFGYHHASYLDNLRFYYNPITSLIEPITHDNSAIFLLENSGLVGANRQLGELIDYKSPVSWFGRWQTGAWHDAVFKDTIFYRAYIAELERISEVKYLKNFFTTCQQELHQKQKILYRDYPFFNFDPTKKLYENQEYIRKKLRSEILIHAYYDLSELKQGRLILEFSNLQEFPVEIVSVSTPDPIELELSGGSRIIQASQPSHPNSLHKLEIALPTDAELTDKIISGLKISCKILGSTRVVATTPIRKPALGDFLTTFSSENLQPNIEDFPFLDVDQVNREIRIEAGSIELDRSLIIPQGFHLLAREGTEINLIQGASIISHSPIYLVGYRDQPIIFHSSDSSSTGIAVLNADGRSELHNVHFENLSGPTNIDGGLIASVTFHNSPVYIDHCYFSNISKGKSALLIAGSNYDIDNSVFHCLDGNGIDLNFSEGIIENSNFFDVQGSTVQLSKSKASLENLGMKKGGRGIYTSANSTVYGRNVRINDVEVAVISQDLSDVQLEKVEIRNCGTGYMAFQNDPRFGSAKIDIGRDSKISGSSKFDYLVDEGSRLTVNKRLRGIQEDPEVLKKIMEIDQTDF